MPEAWNSPSIKTEKKRDALNYNFAFCIVWIWNFVSSPKALSIRVRYIISVCNLTVAPREHCILLAYFPYFEKIKVVFCELYAVSV
jgi:hypothetical protein